MLSYPPLQVASVLVLFHYTCMAETVFVVQHKNYKADVPVDCKIICAHICLAFPSYLISICVRWHGFLCDPFDSTLTSNSYCRVLKPGDELPWWGMSSVSSVPTRTAVIVHKFGHGRPSPTLFPVSCPLIIPSLYDVQPKLQLSGVVRCFLTSYEVS